MARRLVNRGAYERLIGSLRDVLTQGLVEAQRLLEYQRVKTYWHIGREINLAVEKSQGVLQINTQLYERIKDDIEKDLHLELSADTLKRSIQFARVYPTFPKNTPLSFTHYLTLMRVKDPKKRIALEAKAIKLSIPALQLKRIVMDLNQNTWRLLPSSKSVLACKRGEPYIYLARSFENLIAKEEMGVDCGFKIYVPLKGGIIQNAATFAKHSTVRYVCSTKLSKGYKLTLATRKRQSIYTYAARVLKIVDGDTLDVLIDVGFGIRVHERVRLKGINAPESNTPAGQKAKKFLITHLKQCPIVIIRTSKAGMYGRWLADVFTLPKSSNPHTIAAKGIFLNQLMLDQNHAQLYV